MNLYFDLISAFQKAPHAASVDEASSSLKAYLPILVPFIAGAMGYFLAIFRFKNEKKENTAKLLKRYKLPLYLICLELEDRIQKVIANLSRDWLDEAPLNKIKNDEGFAKSPHEFGYFQLSTSYLFAKYFCQIEIIANQIGSVYDLGDEKNKKFLKRVALISRSFQHKEMWNTFVAETKFDPNDFTDAWRLHRQFQHSIGELLIIQEGSEKKCMSFEAFLRRYVDDPKFRYWIIALESYFVGLANFGTGPLRDQVIKNKDLRPLRLVAIQHHLYEMIVLLGDTLSIDPPEKNQSIYEGLPDTVISSIKDLKLRSYEVFLPLNT